MRILVADDDYTTQQVLSAILGHLGEIVFTGDGQAAVEAHAAARQSGRPFAAVVLDILMPGLGGLDAARRIKAAEAKDPGAAKPARIVFLSTIKDTGAKRDDLAREFAEACFAPKPVERDALLAAVL